ncbi:hypothetical protein PYV61_24055, partial [Roseisolibacter sp. H3M3-2]|nr:hypothetical protein [Roseisolibacter sp. H3M3-2]
ALALVLGAGGAAAWLWPARERVAPLAPAIPAPPAPAAAVVPDPTRALRMASRNPFSATREAPRARWAAADAMDPMGAVTTAQTPPGLLPDPTVRVPGEPRAAPAPPPAPDPEARARERDRATPALQGIMMGAAEGPRALLRLDPRIPGAQLYAEGAEARGGRVARIEAGELAVGGRGGRRVTLRLGRLAAPR